MSVPTFGPTGLQNVHDDAPTPYAIVRLDYRVSRVELFAALVLGFTETNVDRDPDSLSVEEIRQEVEACLAASSFNDVWFVVERLERREFSDVQERRLEALERALERAYPPRALGDEVPRSGKLGDLGERCPAAHPEDPTPCGGPVVVTVLDATNAGANGCEHHGARLLASLDGGRVYGLPDAPEGTAIRTFKAAAGLRPFPWVERGEGR